LPVLPSVRQLPRLTEPALVGVGHHLTAHARRFRIPAVNPRALARIHARCRNKRGCDVCVPSRVLCVRVSNRNPRAHSHSHRLGTYLSLPLVFGARSSSSDDESYCILAAESPPLLKALPGLTLPPLDERLNERTSCEMTESALRPAEMNSASAVGGEWILALITPAYARGPRVTVSTCVCMCVPVCCVGVAGPLSARHP
jgi:hypothetical protein